MTHSLAHSDDGIGNHTMTVHGLYPDLHKLEGLAVFPVLIIVQLELDKRRLQRFLQIVCRYLSIATVTF